MTGNVPELNDPANSGTRKNVYPSAYYTTASQGPEPSIRSRKLYIPLNIWFTLAAKMAFPLISLQYNELHIEIEIRELIDFSTVLYQKAFYHQALKMLDNIIKIYQGK